MPYRQRESASGR